MTLAEGAGHGIPGPTNGPRRTARNRPGRRWGFIRAMVLITTVSHVPVAIAAAGLLARVGVPCATVAGIAWAALMSALFVAVLLRSVPDRRRSPWEVALFELPGSIEGCAALFAFFPIVLATIAISLGDFVRDEPLRLPTEITLYPYGLALVASAYGTLLRRRCVRVVHRDVRLASLDRRLDGLRVVHISDLHIGTMTPKARGMAWARAVMRSMPDVVVVTGDLITSGTDYLDDAADVVRALRAPLGVFVSLGNHDYFGDVSALQRKLAMGGARVLRNDGTVVEYRGAQVWIGGVDDTWTNRADAARALASRPKGTAALLLSHDPSVFSHPACGEVDLVFSGHTHAGQVAIPFAVRTLNLSRLSTPYSSGIYRRGRATLHVSPGLGTTGPPIRIGAAPEITILVLRSSAS